MPHCRLHHALAPLIVAVLTGSVISARQWDAVTPNWVGGTGQPAHRATIDLEGARPVILTVLSEAGASEIRRLTDTSTRAVHLLHEWFGPLPTPSLTVVDLPWAVEAPSASYPGAVATRFRAIAPERDVTAERALIAAVARQFWFGDGDGAFREALVAYSATRAIHTLLDGRNFEAPRYFGGFVPLPIRSLILSPSIPGSGAPFGEFLEVLQPPDAAWRFAPLDDGSAARRGAAALRSLERMIGWPAMQQALSALRAERAGMTPELFAAIVAVQRGVGMEWFARDLVRSDKHIDYAVGGVSSETSAAGMRTRVIIERRGSGVFTATDQPRSAGAARSVTALVRFADGGEARATIDGRDDRSELIIESASAPETAIVDPDTVVLMDADRTNNAWTARPPLDRMGLRLLANWMLWLQNVMLTYTAVA